MIKIGNYLYDSEQALVMKDSRKVYLTVCENKFLRLLSSNPGKTFLYHQIAVSIYGSTHLSPGFRANLRGIMKRMRGKMGLTYEDKTITNRNGIGYLIPAEVISDQPCVCPNCGQPH